MEKDIVFGGNLQALPDYEIKFKVKLPGPNHWTKETIDKSLEIIYDLANKAALTASVVTIAATGLNPNDEEEMKELLHLDRHLKDIEKSLYESWRCASAITKKSLLKNWPQASPEIKLIIKQTILKHLESDLPETAKAKLREDFAELINYEGK